MAALRLPSAPQVRLVLEYCDKGSLREALDQHAFMQQGDAGRGAGGTGSGTRDAH